MPLIDPKPLWDFDDPVASGARFLAAADGASDTVNAAWLTQVARSMGLQGRIDMAHAVLDSLAVSGVGVVAETSASGTDEVAVRIDLERGRLFNSSGDPSRALPLFEAAAARADRAGLEELRIDALHMAAIAAPDPERLARNEVALTAARAAVDPAARDWDASILNNIGMAHADSGDFATALEVFQEALAARERIGDPARTRVARWMIGWVLRNLGRTGEALEVQRALKAELTAAGASDPYVDEELALLEATSKDA